MWPNHNHAMARKTKKRIHEMMTFVRSTGLWLKSQLLPITVIMMLLYLGAISVDAKEVGNSEI
jgi:uncharacterized membrane protein YbaN (DUF454 family)